MRAARGSVCSGWSSSVDRSAGGWYAAFRCRAEITEPALKPCVYCLMALSNRSHPITDQEQ